MKLFTWINIGLFSVSICSAEIITRSFVLQENNFVDIENDIVDSIHGHFLYKNQISDSIEKIQCLRTSIDLAYQLIALWDNFDCGCGGSVYGVTSSQPVYTITTQSISIFRTPIDTTDTTISEKGNRRFSQECPLWSATQPESSGGVCGTCVYPITPARFYWFLSKTIKNHYFLFRFDDASTGKTPQSKPVAKINCIIQTDGSLDFSKAFTSPAITTREKRNHTVTRANSTIKKVLTSEIASPKGTLYNIQGKRINKSVSGAVHGKVMRLYIISNK